jgi:hypothetical protein
MQTYYPTEDTNLNIARGLVKGASVRNLFGYNAAIGTSYIAAWELNSAYVFPVSPLTMTVTHNVADNGVIIRIIGLDGDYNPIAENVTLSSGSVTTALQFFRINDVVTIFGNAVNNITITNGGVTYAAIRGGEGRNQASIFTVPAGHSFYLNRIDAFCATALQNNRQVFFRNFTQLSSGVILRVAESTFLEKLNIQRQLPFKYTEKTDIQFQVRGSAGEQYISVFGEGILLKEPQV